MNTWSITRADGREFDIDLVHEFFQGFATTAGDFAHRQFQSRNAHHQAETIFKAFGRALRMASEMDPRAAGALPSTKGTL